ncbi:MAG: ABC transporter ATP-binding protein [Bacteroidales bacterium]|nr:ABC transporter ATP-binding protein [Bacteroidales bacterium]MDD4683807.1 ABC transporter ATP-binding protein [Bacteroidales bacterium]
MIEINNLKFSYKRNKMVIDDISLNIEKGYIHGLLGKNGIGKTTLLKLMAGLLFPNSGDIEVLGYTPMQRKVGFLQDIFFLSEEFDVYKMSIENYVKLNSVFYPKFSETDFYNYLEEFEITDRKSKLNALSFGTKKKVIIAFGLATHARLMILDEPTNGLDIPSKAQFRKIILKAMNDETTIIISTHQVRDLHNLIDSILIMDERNILINASNREITSKLYFGVEKDISNIDNILYSEDNIGGNLFVKENRENLESNLDIELFFNAVFHNKEKIKSILSNNNK